MTYKLNPIAVPTPKDKANNASILRARMALNQLTGADSKTSAHRAIRLGELLDLGVLEIASDGQLRVVGNGGYLPQWALLDPKLKWDSAAANAAGLTGYGLNLTDVNNLAGMPFASVRWVTGTPNAPAGIAGAGVWTPYSATAGGLLSSSASTGRVFFKPYSGGVWQPLVEFWTDKNLDPASKQDAGFLTGTSANVRLHNSSGFGVGGSFQINATPTMTYRIDDVQQLAITSGGNTIFGNDSTTTYIQPNRDNAVTCGRASNRFSVVYAGTTSINPSDARLKTPVRPLTEPEIAAAVELSGEIGIYQWLAMIAEKGEEGARLHVGMTVQRAIEIMESHGLDPFRYGFICYDEWEDEWEDVETQVMVPTTEEQTVVEVVGDVAVQVRRVVEVMKPALDMYPLVDEQGNPVLGSDGLPCTYEVARTETTRVQTRTSGNQFSFRVAELLLFIVVGERQARINADM